MPAHRRPAAKNKKVRTPRPRRARPLAKRTPSLLILECDAPKLASQGVSAASDLHALVKFVPGCLSVHVRTTSMGELLRDLGDCKTKYDAFDIIVAVGHSNMTGIAMTSYAPLLSWTRFAKFLQPLKPKRVALIACQAGAWLPAKALFGGIPSLAEVYGSPVLTNEKQMALLQVLVPMLLAGVRVDPELMRLAQVANFALTKGVLFRQTRAEFKRSDPTEDLARVGLEFLLSEVVRNLPPLP